MCIYKTRRFHAYFRTFLLIYLVYTAIQTPVFAAAWTQGARSGQVIMAFDSYSTSGAFDKDLNPVSQVTKFSKYELNPYLEYGVTKDITIGANPLLQDWRAKKSGIVTTGQILESEFFFRKKLMELGNAVFSFQPLVKTPCMPISGSVNLFSCDSYDMELRLLAGYGFKLEQNIKDGRSRPFSGQYHFVDLEAAYRKHTDHSSDVVKIDGTAGFRFNKNILLLGQFFSSIPTRAAVVAVNSVDRSNDLKLQFSSIFQTSKLSSVQLGFYEGIAAQPSENNYKTYQGVLLSFWKGF